MQINFFEEFPTAENLKKISIIPFPTIVFITAHSIAEFNEYRKELLKYNSNIEVAYWPLFKKSYWLSGFAYTEEIINLYNDLKNNKQEATLKILLDLELPLLNAKLFYKNIFKLSKNKKIISQIFSETKSLNIEIHTAEYPFGNKIIQRIFSFLGASYSLNKYPHFRIVMYYTSMFKSTFIKNQMCKFIKNRAKTHQNNFHVGLGCTAIGILGDEPIITPENLENDFAFLKEHGIKSTTIFRLGGINDEYLEILKKYYS